VILFEGICHSLTTYKGDDQTWKDLVGARTVSTLGPYTPQDESGGKYAVDKHYLFFEVRILQQYIPEFRLSNFFIHH
jgi:hypothetical protein